MGTKYTYSRKEVNVFVCLHVGLGVVVLEVDLGCQGTKGQWSPQTLFHCFTVHVIALLTLNCEGKS